MFDELAGMEYNRGLIHGKMEYQAQIAQFNQEPTGHMSSKPKIKLELSLIFPHSTIKRLLEALDHFVSTTGLSSTFHSQNQKPSLICSLVTGFYLITRCTTILCINHLTTAPGVFVLLSLVLRVILLLIKMVSLAR